MSFYFEFLCHTATKLSTYLPLTIRMKLVVILSWGRIKVVSRVTAIFRHWFGEGDWEPTDPKETVIVRHIITNSNQ